MIAKNKKKFNIETLWHYSQCPKYYSYSEEMGQNNLLMRYFDVNVNYWLILQEAYRRRTKQHGEVNWSDLRTFICGLEDDSVEGLLRDALAWDSKIFSKDKRIGLANIEASVPVHNSVIVDTIPLIVASSIGTQVALVVPVVNDVDTEILYNDFILRFYLWLAALYLEIDIHCIEFVNFKKRESQVTKLIIHNNNELFGQIVSNIVKCIQMDILYPSKTEMCANCKYKRCCEI